MPPRRLLAVLAVTSALMLALILGLALTLEGSSGRSSSAGSSQEAAPASGFHGALLPAGLPPREFTLTDEHGRAVSLVGLRGRVTILAFLSSACPTTCTLIAQQIRGALDELGSAVPTLLISVDPAADKPARVSAFLRKSSLLGRVRFLSGPRARLAAVWRAYGIVPLSAGERAYARSASVFLLGRDGGERVLFTLEQLTPESLAADTRRLAQQR
jgi:protein SCO1/2